ncbi:hypothetical protein Tco_0836542 [Tanacetum coccineum]
MKVNMAVSLIAPFDSSDAVTTRRNSDDDVPNFEAMITAALKPLAFRSAATSLPRQRLDTPYAKFISVLDTRQFQDSSLLRLKLEGDVLIWWKLIMRTQFERLLLLMAGWDGNAVYQGWLYYGE